MYAAFLPKKGTLMKKLRTSIAWILLSALLLSAVSCSNAPELPDTPAEDTQTTASETETAPETETETTRKTQPDLPAKTFDGYTFRILNPTPILSDEQTGEVVNDAVYRANTEVSEQLNIVFDKVEVANTKSTADQKIFAAFFQAGDNAYDIANYHDCNTAMMALNGWFMNIKELPYIDTSADWWPQVLTDTLTLNGKMYFFTNYSNYKSMFGTQVLFFNKDILTANNMEAPYTAVREGTWTLDKMAEMTRTIYTDVNGDGKRDNGDTIGFVATGYPYRWLESFGVEAYRKTAPNSSELTLEIQSERTYSLIEKLHNWFYSGSNGVWERFSEAASIQQNMFTAGKAAFVSDAIGLLSPLIADSDINYGIIPLPKLDENQEDYYAGCNSELIHVPIWTTNTELVGMVIEAMSYAGYKHVLPAYGEKTLKGRYASDKDCTEMLNLVFKKQVMSFAYLFATAVPQGMQRNLLATTVKENNVASYYRSNEAKELAMMKTITDFYAD